MTSTTTTTTSTTTEILGGSRGTRPQGRLLQVRKVPRLHRSKVHLSLRSLSVLLIGFGCFYLCFSFWWNTSFSSYEKGRQVMAITNDRGTDMRSPLWAGVQYQESQHHLLRPMPRIENCTAVYPSPLEIKEWQKQKLKQGRQDGLSSGGQQKQQKCALLFFGLAKAFRQLVLPTIHKHILDKNPHCEIFAHTYDIKQLTNIRNGETGQKIDPTQLYDMTSNVLIESLEDYARQHNLTYLMQPKFQVHSKHGWAPISYPNMLKQWHSIWKVWQLMQQYEYSNDIHYDRVGLFRSDVYYVTDIDIMSETETDVAVIPSFGKMGNDRMFYGTYENAYVWANIRFPSVDCYEPEIPTQGLHSEHFMERLILPNIPNWTERNDVCFLRVRGEGEIQDGDCNINYDGPTDWKETVRKINRRTARTTTINKNLQVINSKQKN